MYSLLHFFSALFFSGHNADDIAETVLMNGKYQRFFFQQNFQQRIH